MEKLDFGAQSLLYRNALLELIDQLHAPVQCSFNGVAVLCGLPRVVAGRPTFASTLTENLEHDQGAGVEVHVGSAERELEQDIVEEDFGLALVQRDLQLGNQPLEAPWLIIKLLPIEHHQGLCIVTTG